jgi:hypothetical protein
MAQSIRQFVIMPLGSDYTVETQITGADLIGGLQVEVTPVKRAQSRLYTPKPVGTQYFNIFVRTLIG